VCVCVCVREREREIHKSQNRKLRTDLGYCATIKKYHSISVTLSTRYQRRRVIVPAGSACQIIYFRNKRSYTIPSSPPSFALIILNLTILADSKAENVYNYTVLYSSCDVFAHTSKCSHLFFLMVTKVCLEPFSSPTYTTLGM